MGSKKEFYELIASNFGPGDAWEVFSLDMDFVHLDRDSRIGQLAVILATDRFGEVPNTDVDRKLFDATHPRKDPGITYQRWHLFESYYQDIEKILEDPYAEHEPVVALLGSRRVEFKHPGIAGDSDDIFVWAVRKAHMLSMDYVDRELGSDKDEGDDLRSLVNEMMRLYYLEPELNFQGLTRG